MRMKPPPSISLVRSGSEADPLQPRRRPLQIAVDSAKTARDYLDNSRGLLPEPEAIIYTADHGPGPARVTAVVERSGRDLSPLNVSVSRYLLIP
jgi:hypothetical protein